MKTTLLSFIVSLPLFLFSQFEVIYTPPCDYIPLEFQEDIDHVWTHLVIDSSFIEYRDSNARYQAYYKDGMEQFGFDGGSFIHDNFLYSITEVDYDLDLAGYYIEKIDLNTGEKIWTIRTDLRHADYREKLLSTEIFNNQLKLNGIRCILSEDHLAPSNFKIGGRIDAYYFQRVYNLETGQLLSYNTINDGVEEAHIIHYRTNRNYFLKVDENVFDFLNRNISREGGFTERVRISDFGLAYNPTDTIIESFYNTQDLTEARFSLTRKFLQIDNGDIIHLDQVFFGEDFNASQPLTRISKYDKEYNLIKYSDLNSLGLSSYGSIGLIHSTDDDKILLRGCLDQNLNLPCRYFYLIFDNELNHLNTLTPYVSNHYFSFTYNTEIIQEDNSIIAIDKNTELDGNSNFVFYRLKSDNQYDTLKVLTIKEDNWGSWASNVFQLENGDLLIKFNYGCLDDTSHFASWNPTWMRLKAEDLQLITSTEDIVQKQNSIHAYPNPVSDVLNLKSDRIIAGSINIVNALGKVVYNQNINTTSEFRINVAHLESGMYNIAVFGVDGSSQTFQFVKL